MRTSKSYFIIFLYKFPEKPQSLRKYGAPARFIQHSDGGGGGGVLRPSGTDRVKLGLSLDNDTN